MAFVPWFITVLVLIGAALSAICQRNSKAQYYIKNFFLFWWYMGTAALVIPIALFRPGDSINMGWWSFWVRYTFTSWMFGVTLKTNNTEELEYDGPCVIVCNHQTALDQVALLEIWPSGRSTIMTKKSLKYAGTMGIACMLSGLIFVDRLNTEKAKSQTTKECLDYLSQKKGKLWIYPEGTRTGNREEHMLPFKKGAFHIAIEAQVPIIPVVFSSYKSMYSDKNKKFGDVNITLTVLPKISTQGLTADDVTSLSDRVRCTMLDTFYKTSPHVERPPSVEPEEMLPMQAVKDNKNDESVKEIETVSSHDSDQNESIHVGEEIKSENLVDIGASDIQSQKSHNLGSVNEVQNSANSLPSETKTSTESAENSDLSKSTLLVDVSEAENAEDSSLSTPKIENDESPSSQASSDSFVFVNSSKLEDVAKTEEVVSPSASEPTSENAQVSPSEIEADLGSADTNHVDFSTLQTSTKDEGFHEEPKALSVEDIHVGDNTPEHKEESPNQQQDVCTDERRQEPITSSE